MRWLPWLLVLACGGDVGVTPSDDGTTGEPDTSGPPAGTVSSTTASTALTTAVEDSSSSDASGSSESSGAPAECGNGIVEDGEECDGEGCRSDCLSPCRVDFVTQVDAGEGEQLFLEDVAETPDGTVIAVGSLGWIGGDVVTARVDPDGVLLDLDVYDHSGGTDLGVGVEVADDGSRFVVVDTSDGPVVLHYDAGGELVFADAQPEGLTGTGIAAMPDGGVVVSGTAELGMAGHREVWAARYDAAGHVWSATWATAPLEEPWNPTAGHVAVSASGQIFVVAQQPSVSGDFGVYDPVVVAFGPDGGAPLWSWSEWLESTNLDLQPRDIVVDAQGRVAALYFVAHGSASNAHVQLRVFEPDGRPVRAFDSDALELEGGVQAGALVADADGRLIVFSRRVGTAAGEASGRTLVLGFDPDGEIVCNETPEESLGWIAGASLDHAGDILVVGTQFTDTSASYGTLARIRGFEPHE